MSSGFVFFVFFFVILSILLYLFICFSFCMLTHILFFRFFSNWEENFDGFVDSRPFGPMAVALDFDFPQATNFYGLSQHAESLSLKATT